MKKIFKILNILVMSFVLFSCANPSSNDDWTDVTEETTEVQTYSITFTTENPNFQVLTNYLNSLPEFKNLEEGTEVMLYKHVYLNSDASEVTKEIVETSVHDFSINYDNNTEIDSVVIGNEDVEVEVACNGIVTFK